MFQLHLRNHHLINKTLMLCALMFLICLCTADSSAQDKRQANEVIKCSLFLKDRMLDVRLEMPANKLDKTNFSISDWAGQNNYADNIYRVSAADKNGKSLPVERKGDRSWEVTNNHQPFALTYTVISQKDSFMGNNIRNHFHPTLFKNYVFLWGYTFLLQPDEKEIAALPVKLQINANEYGNAYTNFPDGAATFDDFADLFIAAGSDYRAVQREAGGRKVQFLLHGKNWKFTDEEFIGAVSHIIEAQVKYMGFYPAAAETLLVTLNEGTPNSQGGTVVKNVISVYPNTQGALQNLEILKLISHEHFHIWNGNYLHDAGDKGEGYYKWLSEGFTEYYAGLTLYRENLISGQEFIKWLNEVLLEYQVNQMALTATADVMAENYWKSNTYNRLPYVKGALIGMLTDLQLRQKTSGKKQIDDFMRLLAKNTEKSKGYNDETLLATLDALAPGGNRQFYADFMLGAKLLPVVEVTKNSGIVVTEQPRDVFDLGFVTESGKIERGTKVKQLTPDSPAAKAGLKEGDELRSFSFNSGRPQSEATIGIQRKDEAVQVRFYPKKSQNILQIDEKSVFPK